MIDPPNAPHGPDADDADDPNAAAVRSLLKRAFGPQSRTLPVPDLLPGVQRRIRMRSRRRFFADGWSSSQARVSYVLAGMITVALAILAYLALGPSIR